MVQVILAGRKTMTRRIMKPQIKACDHSIFTEADWKDAPKKWSSFALKTVGKTYCELCGNGIEFSKDNGGIKCPYGKPGDILWVRESWHWIDGPIGSGWYGFKADHEAPDLEKWKPSIHLPKEGSRIWLEVTEVRVERLNDISKEDAIAEGIESWIEERMKSRPTHYKVYYQENPSDPSFYCSNPIDSFETLWQSINGPESWKVNPWVWVVSFKVLSTTGKPEEAGE